MLHRHPGGLPLTERLIDYCMLGKLAKVVDVGCGEGWTVQYLRDKRGLDAVGIDTSAERLMAGKLRASELPLSEASGDNMPFAPDSVDAVIAECSLSVMNNPWAVIMEMNRILAPGGKMAITDVYEKNPDSALPPVFFTQPLLTGFLAENGFKVLVWEDHAAYLAEFTAGFIMKYGSIQALWQCIAPGKNCSGGTQPIKIKKPGYFLLVAEKPLIIMRG